MLSAVIIARDEADRIEAAIRSVHFADECIVLDSGSRDDTVALAEALGARVVRTDWPGFVAQKNRAWAEARGEWVLSIDADERVSPELQAAVLAVMRAPGAQGYRVRRRNTWLGHVLKAGHWYPDARVRLARKTSATWSGVEPHDQLEVEGRVDQLEGDLLHIPYRNLGEHLRTIDRYTALTAAHLRAEGRRAGVVDLWLRPPWRFFSAFILAGGWRDGAVGFLLAALGAVYCLLKWARVAGLVPMPETGRSDR